MNTIYLVLAGGLRVGIADYLNSNPADGDYCLLINDDVQFIDRSI